MNGFRYGEGVQIVPLLCEAVSASFASSYVKISNANWLTLLVAVGTCDTATTLTVEASTAVSTTGAYTIPFQYRLSGAINSDTWSAITTCDSAGFALVASTDSSKVVLIDIDPSSLDDGYNYIHLIGTATNYSTAMATTVIAMLEARYKQLNPISSS